MLAGHSPAAPPRHRSDAMPFGESLVIATYCVPTKPGWVRPLANVLLDREATLGNTLAERALSVFMNFATPKVCAPRLIRHALA